MRSTASSAGAVRTDSTGGASVWWWGEAPSEGHGPPYTGEVGEDRASAGRDGQPGGDRRGHGVEALARQEELQSKYTGGTVLHLYMNERVSSPDACKALVRRSLERFRLPYITITPTFSICPSHGYLAGEHEYCPKCDQERLEEKRRKLAA